MIGIKAKPSSWLGPSTSWYADPSRWAVELAQSGPASWPRVQIGDRKPPVEPVPTTTVSAIRQTDSSISFHVSKLGTPVLVKVSYFPNWHASGATGPWRVTPNLMVVVPTSHEVTLTYGRSTSDDLGDACSVLALLGLVAVGAAAVYRRRKSAGQQARHIDGSDDLGRSELPLREWPMLGAPPRGDEERVAGLVHAGGVPDPGRVDHGLARVQFDDVRGPSGRSWITSTRPESRTTNSSPAGCRSQLSQVAALLGDDDQPPLVAVGGEAGSGRRQVVGCPGEVGQWGGGRAQSEMDEGLDPDRRRSIRRGGTSWRCAGSGSPTGHARPGRRASRCPGPWTRRAGRWPTTRAAPCG